MLDRVDSSNRVEDTCFGITSRICSHFFRVLMAVTETSASHGPRVDSNNRVEVTTAT